MSGFMKRSVLESMMTTGEGPGCPFSMHPLRDAIDDLFTGNVVADEIHEVTLTSGKNFLKSFENELVDQKVIHGCEVGPESHVVEIVISLRGSERRVNKLLVIGRIRDAPLFKVSFESLELALCQVVPESARSTVRKESDLSVFESKDLGGPLRGRGFLHGDFFGFSEVVSTTVGTQLLCLSEETVVVSTVQHLGETLLESGDAAIVSEMSGVFTSFRPVNRDAKGFADFLGSPLGHCFLPELEVNLAAFFGVTLSSTGPGGGSVTNGLDEGASHRLVGDLVVIDIELQERHRAFDVDAHRAGIDMSGRSHYAADGCAVSKVGIRIENHLGHAGSGLAVSDLLDGGVAKGVENRFVSDHRDGLALGVGSRNEGSGRTGGMDLWVHEIV